MAVYFVNRQVEEKTPYYIVRFDMVRSPDLKGYLASIAEGAETIDFVGELDRIQKHDLGRSVQASIDHLMDGQFLIVNGDHGIWALGMQKGNHVELIKREDDERTAEYLFRHLFDYA
jgi:hypothetical protein